MRRTTWLTMPVLGLAAAALLTPALARAADGAPPGRANIVLITADNLGYGDLPCYGNRRIKTPNLDRLAADGVRCTDFYITSPTCTASRAALLTGRYPQRNGLNKQLSVAENMGVGLRPSELLLPRFMPAHYTNACFGKWNIGFAPGSRPTERGFDEFFGHASGNMDYYTHVYNGRNDLFRGTKPARVEGYSTDLFADATCEFIRRNAARPFFAYLPFNAPHYPNARNKAPGVPTVWQAPAEAFEAYGYSPDEQDGQKRYHAVITAVDTAIGRVLAEIDALGLRDNTLVIFFSDNGAFMSPGRGLEVASNKPLCDGGTTLWEGGIRVPCLVRWPGRIKPGTVCREPLIHMDFFAMALRAAGADLPRGRVIDGRDPTATLAGEAPSPHEALYFDFRGMSAVRSSGHYKIVKPKDSDSFQLYDVVADVAETKDLAADEPELVARLQQQFERWMAELADSTQPPAE